MEIDPEDINVSPASYSGIKGNETKARHSFAVKESRSIIVYKV